MCLAARLGQQCAWAVLLHKGEKGDREVMDKIGSAGERRRAPPASPHTHHIARVTSAHPALSLSLSSPVAVRTNCRVCVCLVTLGPLCQRRLSLFPRITLA